ncbi:hypothetical protein GCM10027596_34310 [Nocardioides korecus]
MTTTPAGPVQDPDQQPIIRPDEDPGHRPDPDITPAPEDVPDGPQVVADPEG